MGEIFAPSLTAATATMMRGARSAFLRSALHLAARPRLALEQ